MGSKKPPAPPKITPPTPSAEETQLMKMQADYAQQLMSQGSTVFSNSQADRGQAMNYLDVLKNPSQLSSQEQDLVNKMGDSYLSQYQKGITEGQGKEIFDKNVRDSLAYLSDRGILNSTTGKETMDSLYKEKSRALTDASAQAAQQKLGLTKDFMDKTTAKNMDLFQTLYSGQTAGGNLAATLGNSGVQNLQGVTQQQSTNRLNTYNANVQNAQAQYAYDQQVYQQQKQRNQGLFGLAGAGLGLALAPFTGGLSLFGSTLGAMGSASLGGALGSSIGGFI